jgi:hypothetical protein
MRAIWKRSPQVIVNSFHLGPHWKLSWWTRWSAPTGGCDDYARSRRSYGSGNWRGALRARIPPADLAVAYTRNPILAEVQRRMEAAERSYYRALKQMQQIQKEAQAAKEAEEERKWRAYLRSLPDEAFRPPSGAPKLASILPGDRTTGSNGKPDP